MEGNIGLFDVCLYAAYKMYDYSGADWSGSCVRTNIYTVGRHLVLIFAGRQMILTWQTFRWFHHVR
jgi:hypothetical protein